MGCPFQCSCNEPSVIYSDWGSFSKQTEHGLLDRLARLHVVIVVSCLFSDVPLPVGFVNLIVGLVSSLMRS